MKRKVYFLKNFLNLWNVTISMNMTIKQYFINLYIYSYDFNNEIIIRIYIYRKDTNTCESLKQSIQWKKKYSKLIMF